ncbi:hypothetical protein D3C71_1038650 [compost metagenome]
MRRLSVLSTTHHAHTAASSASSANTLRNGICSIWPGTGACRLSCTYTTPTRNAITAHSDTITIRYCPRRKFTLMAQRCGSKASTTLRSWSAARDPVLQRSWQRDSSVQHSEQMGAA